MRLNVGKKAKNRVTEQLAFWSLLTNVISRNGEYWDFSNQYLLESDNGHYSEYVFTFHSESESSESLDSPDIGITPWWFLQNSMSAMQKQASVQDNSFMLQGQRLLHSEFLQLHVVNSRMLLGAGSLFIKTGFKASSSTAHPWFSGEGNFCIVTSKFLQTKFSLFKCQAVGGCW